MPPLLSPQKTVVFTGHDAGGDGDNGGGDGDNGGEDDDGNDCDGFDDHDDDGGGGGNGHVGSIDGNNRIQKISANDF